MRNIEKAIEKEQEYIAHRTKGEEPFHLVDIIKECGFNSLDEYFTEKREYEFDKLQFAFANVPPSEAIAEIFRMMETKETKVLFVASEETFVFSGNSKAFNAEYCNENSIPIYPLYTGGGTIVSTPGDFSLVICFPEIIGADVQFILEKLKYIFSRYMDKVEVTDNDILVSSSKVCGSVMYQQNSMNCFACHFSFKDNTELIEKICNISGSIKTPSVITGLTVATFKKELSEWLRV